jgi:aminopeptidase N
VREHLEDLLDDKDPYLRIEVVAALQALGDLKSRGPLRRALNRELDGRVARRIREALRDMGEASAHERKRVNDELENVKTELAELKARLSRLEVPKKKDAEKDPKAELPSKARASKKPASGKTTKASKSVQVRGRSKAAANPSRRKLR